MNKNIKFKNGQIFYYLPSKCLGEITGGKVHIMTKFMTNRGFVAFRLFGQKHSFQTDINNLKPKQTELRFIDE